MSSMPGFSGALWHLDSLSCYLPSTSPAGFPPHKWSFRAFVCLYVILIFPFTPACHGLTAYFPTRCAVFFMYAVPFFWPLVIPSAVWNQYFFISPFIHLCPAFALQPLLPVSLLLPRIRLISSPDIMIVLFLFLLHMAHFFAFFLPPSFWRSAVLWQRNFPHLLSHSLDNFPFLASN